MTESVLTVDGLRKIYNPGRPAERMAIDSVGFSVEKGEFLAIVGPSGCGKTTLLRCVSGLDVPSSGSVQFEGEPISSVPTRLGIVFQDYSRSLYPWFTNAQNIELPLKVRGMRKAERRAVVEEMLEAVGIGHVGSQYPWQLSGGMQQRVAIARTLSYRPDLLLMDEPFASVDAQTRFNLEDLVLRIRSQFGIAVVIVTHDIDEAVYLSDRIVVLSGSPSVVREVIDVPLGSEREQVSTRSADTFLELRSRLVDAMVVRPAAAA